MLARSVLITGANRGIGLEMVRQLIADPQPPGIIIATCRDVENAQDLKALTNESPNVHILELDVENYGAYESFKEQVADIVGEQGLSLLINNAGIMLFAKNLQELTPELFQKNYNVNTVAPVILTKTLLPLLTRAAQACNTRGYGAKRAAVINITSELGSMTLCHPLRSILEKSIGDLLPYNCTKAALNMVTRCLAFDLDPLGILVVGLHPGSVQTDMGSTNGNVAALTVEDSVRQNLRTIGVFTAQHQGGYYQYDGQQMPW